MEAVYPCVSSVVLYIAFGSSARAKVLSACSWDITVSLKEWIISLKAEALRCVRVNWTIEPISFRVSNLWRIELFCAVSRCAYPYRPFKEGSGAQAIIANLPPLLSPKTASLPGRFQAEQKAHLRIENVMIAVFDRVKTNFEKFESLSIFIAPVSLVKVRMHTPFWKFWSQSLFPSLLTLHPEADYSRRRRRVSAESWAKLRLYRLRF